MIVDIGGGTTEVAVFAVDIVFSKSIRVGGDKMDAAIIHHMKRKYNLLIGERTAEEVKCDMGALTQPAKVSRRSPGTRPHCGSSKTVTINGDEIREAMGEPLQAIVDAVKVALEATPPELSADIVEKGIVLAGGGALLRNLDILLREATGLPVML